MDLTSWHTKKIAILGYGAEGKSTLRFLLNHWVLPEQITILDSKEIQEKAVRTISGEQYLQDLADYDLIFKSAGIPYFPEIQAVADKVLTQVQFFFDHYQGKVIAITASKGKTTMTSLAGEVVKNAGYRVKVVGNIGKPVLEEIDFETEYDYVVIELSSYMLQTLKKQNFISILGAIFPEHLDRHGGMEEYVKSKLRILEGSEVNIVFSSTVNNPLLPFAKLGVAVPLTGDKTLLSGEGTEYYWDSDFFYVWERKVFPLSDVQLLGEHNLWNISAIVALADVLHIDDEVLQQTVKEFQPVRHRLQKVWTFQGITFYDDAISTTPDSTIVALDALGDQVETIFLGGLDRGYDFSPLVEKIKKSQIKNIVFFPESGKKIKEMLARRERACPFPNTSTPTVNTLETTSMQEAVAFAYQHTSPGKICLLSTASPSYTVWKNFEEKGDLFQKFVVQQSVGSL